MQMKLVSDYEKYYRQYIAKNPLRRAAEWERLLFEALIPRVHAYVVKPWKGRRVWRGY